MKELELELELEVVTTERGSKYDWEKRFDGQN
jgi:hypothetical protein